MARHGNGVARRGAAWRGVARRDVVRGVHGACVDVGMGCVAVARVVVHDTDGVILEKPPDSISNKYFD